jgi:phospholipid transport system substrate-binding protein
MDMSRIASRMAVVGLLILSALQPLSGARAGQPSEVIRQLNATFIEVMRNAAALGFDGRYRTLEPALAAAYDFPEMTRVSSGRYWRGLTDAQKEQAVEAFRAHSTATYAARFNGFNGERFEIIGEEPAPAGRVRVNNQIVPSGGEPIRIDYLLHQKDETWRIVDVYLKSSVSELAVRRSEFTDTLGKSGFDGLIADLKAKTTALRNEDGATGD